MSTRLAMEEKVLINGGKHFFEGLVATVQLM